MKNLHTQIDKQLYNRFNYDQTNIVECKTFKIMWKVEKLEKKLDISMTQSSNLKKI